MKVGHPADKTAPVAVKHSTPVTPDAATSTVASAPVSAIPSQAESSTNVELSSAAASLNSQASSPDFDAEKVARISQAIQDSSFKIDAHVIADKLIGNAKELLTKVQS